jgi:hypothetical protein
MLSGMGMALEEPSWQGLHLGCLPIPLAWLGLQRSKDQVEHACLVAADAGVEMLLALLLGIYRRKRCCQQRLDKRERKINIRGVESTC